MTAPQWYGLMVSLLMLLAWLGYLVMLSLSRWLWPGG